MEKLLTISELMDLTGMSKSTVYHYTSEKKIPYIKLGAKIMFDPQDIRNWLNEKKVKL